MYKTEKEKLGLFIKLRNKYIDELSEKKINKQEFNYKNNEIFEKISLKPFTKIENFEQALYNYNYYNSKAKICLEASNKYKRQNNLKRAKFEENKKINFYIRKDDAILSMVKLEDAKFIEAYYIKMNSKNLENLIYEINFINRDKVILHTKNEIVKKALLEKKCFMDEMRESIISSYINS